MRIGKRLTIIGPTIEESCSFGNQPVGMNKAVSRPHAMNAPMFGITIPARLPPSFCIEARHPVWVPSPAGIKLAMGTAFLFRGCIQLKRRGEMCFWRPSSLPASSLSFDSGNEPKKSLCEGNFHPCPLKCVNVFRIAIHVRDETIKIFKAGKFGRVCRAEFAAVNQK